MIHYENNQIIADTAFINGEVVTIDEKQTITEALAVKDNKIISVGTTMKIKELIGNKTNVIDLEGRSLLPGFVDAHMHLSIYGTNMLDISSKQPEVTSLQDLYKALKKEAENTKKGDWIRAWGFNENTISDKRFPTKKELDEISTSHPILIVRVCNHLSIVNSKSLELANIDDETKNPEGGVIEKDSSGFLTGKLIETAHMQMSNLAVRSDEELATSLKLASDTLIKYGVTSIHDAGGYGDGPRIFNIMKDSIESGDIKVRIYAMIASLTNSEKFINQMKEKNVITGLGDERFKIGPVKLFSDGSSTGPTLATREPYTSDEKNYGILYYEQQQLNRTLIDAHKRGNQITAHAQGDQAIEMVLNSIEAALQEKPRDNHRHRIEHAGIAPPDLQSRMKELGVTIIPNPGFMYENGDDYLTFYGDRVNWMYPANDYINSNINAAFASDAPVIGCNPFIGIHAAVNRKTRTNQIVGKSQTVSVLDALKAYTLMGAYASFEEDIKGNLKEGKLADVIVLNKSILNEKKDKIKDLKVEMTMINGEVVFKSSKTNN